MRYNTVDSGGLNRAGLQNALFQACTALGEVVRPGHVDRGLATKANYLTRQQRAIFGDVLNYANIVVTSAHGIGKTHLIPRLALAYCESHPGARVLIVGAGYSGVRRQVWDTHFIPIQRALGYGKISHGTMLSWVFPNGSRIDVIASDDESQHQGMHAEQLMVFVDEAQKIPDAKYKALRSMCRGEGKRMIVFGNPYLYHSTGQWYHACLNNPRWRRIQLSAFDHENVIAGKAYYPAAVTRQALADDVDLCGGVDTDEFRCRNMGIPPENALGQVLPTNWVRAAVERGKRAVEKTEYHAAGGVDVASGTDRGDQSVIATCNHWHVDLPYVGRAAPTTNGLISLVCEQIDARGLQSLYVDASGVGSHIAKEINEIKDGDGEYKYRRTSGGWISHIAKSIVFNEKSKEQERQERRKQYRPTHDKWPCAGWIDEAWWLVREILRWGFENDTGLALPDDNQLISELTGRRYAYTGNDQIKLESKRDLHARGVRSPDRADAVMLAVSAWIDQDDAIMRQVRAKGEPKEDDSWTTIAVSSGRTTTHITPWGEPITTANTPF